MIEAVIMTLIYIGLICLAVRVAFWALDQFGLGLPDQFQKIIWVIAVLVCLLVLVRVLLPGIGSGRIGAITSEIHAVV